MSEDNKKILEELCATKDIPIFYTPAWLDTVCVVGSWDVAIARSKSGSITAIMPFHLRQKYGLSALIMPKLTPYGGILFFPPDNMIKEETLNSFKKGVCKEIINQLPKTTYFNVAFHPDFRDWQPFMWARYRQKTRYTYRIMSFFDLDRIWEALNSKVRNHISTAKKSIKIEQTDNVDKFYELNKNSFDKQGMEMPYDLSFLKTLYTKVNERIPGSIEIVIAKTEKEVQGAIYTVNDENTVYCLATGLAKDAPRGTMSLLLWNAIENAMKQGKTFDFEGSDLAKVEPFFRSFGGKQTPYFQIFGSRNRFVDAAFVALGKL